MASVDNLYDNGPISPVAKIRENVSILTGGEWSHFRVEMIEPLPRSSPMVADMVALSGGTTVAANGTIQKQVVTFLQLNDKEFLHLRFEPIDDVECVLWEQSSTSKFASRAVQARSSVFTGVRDPWLATTTFFIIGRDRDINLEMRNINPVAIPQARVAFWGYRYILSILEKAPTVTTYLPAEGKQA